MWVCPRDLGPALSVTLGCRTPISSTNGHKCPVEEGRGGLCCDHHSSIFISNARTQLLINSEIHAINPLSLPRRTGSDISPHASSNHRPQLDIGICPQLPLYIWIRMLAIRLRVPDPRIQSLSAVDPPHPTCHSVLRLGHRKLYRCHR